MDKVIRNFELTMDWYEIVEYEDVRACGRLSNHKIGWILIRMQG